MKTLMVKEILKSNIAVDNNDGDLIFEEIKHMIHDKMDIIIDFTDIDLINTAFLNNAIGKIYFMPLKDRSGINIKIANFPSEAMDLLEEVINTAKAKASIY